MTVTPTSAARHITLGVDGSELLVLVTDLAGLVLFLPIATVAMDCSTGTATVVVEADPATRLLFAEVDHGRKRCFVPRDAVEMFDAVHAG